uniref:Valacyclovir hydrolase n=1 Tax=Solanum tuberosum TaxID=4113 RepID=M1AVV7_SOLTU
MAAIKENARSSLIVAGRVMNEAISFLVFIILDILDFILCYTYKVIDFIIEAEWKPCYCSSIKEVITSSGSILVSERGESKIVCLTSSSKLHLEEISDTLYTRPSLMAEVSKLTVKRRKFDNAGVIQQSCERLKNGSVRSTFTVNSTIVEMLQGKMGGQKSHDVTPRWSDCDCNTCNSWSSSCKDSLFVRVDGAKETLFPNFSKAAKSKYRLFAVDLLGFGRSPKPSDSLYTIREHLEMIEKSVLEAHKVKSFHIVAHSLGCILALALAVKYPGSVKSLTLIAPVSEERDENTLAFKPEFGVPLRAENFLSEADLSAGVRDQIALSD